MVFRSNFSIFFPVLCGVFTSLFLWNIFVRSWATKLFHSLHGLVEWSRSESLLFLVFLIFFNLSCTVSFSGIHVNISSLVLRIRKEVFLEYSWGAQSWEDISFLCLDFTVLVSFDWDKKRCTSLLFKCGIYGKGWRWDTEETELLFGGCELNIFHVGLGKFFDFGHGFFINTKLI